MRFHEFLFEDKIDYIEQNMGDKLTAAIEKDHNAQMYGINTPRDILDVLSKVSKKHIQWLANLFVSGQIGANDVVQVTGNRLSDKLTRYDQLKNVLEPSERNLNKLSLSDLDNIIVKYKDVTSKKQAKKEKKKADVIYKDSEILVLKPLTRDASCLYGKGTKWCTSADNSQNMFDYYSKKGPLYIIITKDNKKYQFHFEENEFRDEQDTKLDFASFQKLVTQYPQLKDVFDKKAQEFNVYSLAKKKTDTMLVNVIRTEPKLIKTIEHPSEEVQLAALNSDPNIFEYIKNPSEKIQLAYVKISPWYIEYIKNPTDKVIDYVISKEPDAIQYIDNPSPEIQMKAIKIKSTAIIFIKNPPEEIQLVAVRDYSENLRFIKNPSEAVQLEAIKKNGGAIQHIKNPTDKMKLMAVKDIGSAIQHIKDPSEELQKIAIDKDPGSLGFIKNPSKEIQMYAFDKNPKVISLINDPTEEMIIKAIRNDPYTIHWIQNPTEKVKKLAKKLKELEKR